MCSCAVGDFSWLWTGSAPLIPSDHSKLTWNIPLRWGHSQTFQDREPGLTVDNTVKLSRPAWTHCLQIWTCLHSPLSFDSSLMCHKLNPGCGNVVIVMEFIMFYVSWKWRLLCRPLIPPGVIQKRTSKRHTAVTFSNQLISPRNYITWWNHLSINCWAELSLKHNTNAGWTSYLALIPHMWTHKWLRVDFTCTWRPRADRRLARGLMNCFEQIKRPSAQRLLAASRISLSLYTEVLSAGDKTKSRWFKIHGTEAALSMQQTYKQGFGIRKKSSSWQMLRYKLRWITSGLSAVVNFR